MPRRSYDQYCAAARALDVVGDRWTLLIVRELLAGPRRYTDLHADLPGVSTDMLAARLREMERDGIAARRKLGPPAPSVYVYELTPRGRALLPVLQALGEWGAPLLGERRATDAVRAHWLALPVLRELAGLGEPGVVQVRVEEGEFWVRVGEGAGYGDGSFEGGEVDVRVVLDAEVAGGVARGEMGLVEGVARGRVEVAGVGRLAAALCGGVSSSSGD
ncbi:helix-turn-helix domain-containing protein [Streptomyces sp. NPDC046939]|uniref:winged helix-turn-helix transcriptional regulator n=1 Tax=Streptomyces sp. NPDC046939 TaxID=3155376 RepID=UPI0033FEA333